MSLFPVAVAPGQDLSAERLLQNMRKERFTGELIDIDTESVEMETLLRRLERLSGLSFELSPDLRALKKTRRTFSFRQVP